MPKCNCPKTLKRRTCRGPHHSIACSIFQPAPKLCVNGCGTFVVVKSNLDIAICDNCVLDRYGLRELSCHYDSLDHLCSVEYLKLEDVIKALRKL